MAYCLGVIGSGKRSSTEENYSKAREIGKYIAMNSCSIATGAGSGAPYQAVLGAREAGGLLEGFRLSKTKRNTRKKASLWTVSIKCGILEKG